MYLYSVCIYIYIYLFYSLKKLQCNKHSQDNKESLILTQLKKQKFKLN